MAAGTNLSLENFNGQYSSLFKDVYQRYCEVVINNCRDNGELINFLNSKDKINITYLVYDKIVGVCLATIKDKIEKSIYIDDIFVLEEFRHQGIATKLYKQVESIAKDIGAKRIDLTVWQFNKAAMKFYESLGMETQRKILETRLE